MKFINLNGKKVLVRLLINLFTYSIIALTCYGIMRTYNDNPADIPIMLMLVYSFGLSWFLIFYFAGRHAMGVSRKLFTFISALDLFDNSDYFFGYLGKATPIFYTRECLCGKIEGYPVIISFDLATDKGQSSTLNLEVITVKFNRAHIEQMSVALKRWYEPIGDVKKEVQSFIGNLKSKSSAVGTFEAVIADKRLCLAEDSYTEEI